MAKKKIVSIEDRSPKLKQARKKKANRRLAFYLGILLFLISLIVYLQSPLSHIQQVDVVGNTTIQEEIVQEWSGISSSDNFWSLNSEEVEGKLANHPEIEKVNVSRKLFTTIEINVKEMERVGYIVEAGKYYPVLRNGVLLKDYGLKSTEGDAPILVGFKENEYLVDMAEELHNLPKSISGLISEINWEPTEDNPYKISLFMNDGYHVQGSIRNFSTNMEAYPSIVAQLDPGLQGILHIGVGVYFETTETEKENEHVENTEEEEVKEEVAVNEEIQ